MAVPGRVIVIGAGPAGLTAARALTTAGSAVTVLERNSTPGGRSGLDEVRVGDQVWRFDRGAEFIASFYRATRYLAGQVGMPKQSLVRLPLTGELVFDKRRYPLPTSLHALVRSPLLSRHSKRRAVALGARLSTRSAPSWTKLADSADLDDRNAVRYFTDTVGRDYAERILPATMNSLMLSPAAQTSRVVGMAQFAAAPGVSLYCPWGGLAALWTTVASALDVRYDSAVTAVHPDSTGVSVTTDGEELRADAVLIAGPPSLATALLPGDHPDRPLAEKAAFSPAVKLHLALAAPQAGRPPTCPSGPGRHPLAGVAPLELRHSGQVPEGRGGLEICAAPTLSAELLDVPDRVLRNMLLAEAERLLGGPVGDILGWSVVRQPEAVPLFAVGWLHALRDRAARPAVDGPTGRVHVVGDWLSSPSVEGAVRSALHTCATLLRAT